jgi:regulatory protein YycH of two-component signal transduction system YycFG
VCKECLCYKNDKDTNDFHDDGIASTNEGEGKNPFTDDPKILHVTSHRKRMNYQNKNKCHTKSVPRPSLMRTQFTGRDGEKYEREKKGVRTENG